MFGPSLETGILDQTYLNSWLLVHDSCDRCFLTYWQAKDHRRRIQTTDFPPQPTYLHCSLHRLCFYSYLVQQGIWPPFLRLDGTNRISRILCPMAKCPQIRYQLLSNTPARPPSNLARMGRTLNNSPFHPRKPHQSPIQPELPTHWETKS